MSGPLETIRDSLQREYDGRPVDGPPYYYNGILYALHVIDKHGQTPEATPTLDSAWAAVEALLPEGWIGPAVGPVRKAWRADAWAADTMLGFPGPTPIAALRALAAALEARR